MKRPWFLLRNRVSKQQGDLKKQRSDRPSFCRSGGPTDPSPNPQREPRNSSHRTGHRPGNDGLPACRPCFKLLISSEIDGRHPRWVSDIVKRPWFLLRNRVSKQQGDLKKQRSSRPSFCRSGGQTDPSPNPQREPRNSSHRTGHRPGNDGLPACRPCFKLLISSEIDGRHPRWVSDIVKRPWFLLRNRVSKQQGDLKKQRSSRPSFCRSGGQTDPSPNPQREPRNSSHRTGHRPGNDGLPACRPCFKLLISSEIDGRHPRWVSDIVKRPWFLLRNRVSKQQGDLKKQRSSRPSFCRSGGLDGPFLPIGKAFAGALPLKPPFKSNFLGQPPPYFSV